MNIANPYSTKLVEFPDTILDSLKPNSWERASEIIKNKIASFPSVVIEIGSGSGEHLINRAAKNTEALHIGIEIRFKRLYKTAEKGAQLDLKNLFLVRIFAEELLNIVPLHSVSTVYINFPDPWAKRRWLKHRLVSKAYLEVLKRILKKDGIFSFKTDHPDYFTDVSAAIRAADSGWTLLKETSNLYKSDYIEGNIPTEFERLFISKGLPVHFLETTPIGDL